MTGDSRLLELQEQWEEEFARLYTAHPVFQELFIGPLHVNHYRSLLKQFYLLLESQIIFEQHAQGTWKKIDMEWRTPFCLPIHLDQVLNLLCEDLQILGEPLVDILDEPPLCGTLGLSSYPFHLFARKDAQGLLGIFCHFTFFFSIYGSEITTRFEQAGVPPAALKFMQFISMMSQEDILELRRAFNGKNAGRALEPNLTRSLQSTLRLFFQMVEEALKEGDPLRSHWEPVIS